MVRSLAKLKEKYRKEDPAVVHKRAVPELVILRGHEIRDEGISERRLANLAEFAWTHVHRPCEYIKDYDMTEAEWQEGCKLILLRNFRFICKDAATPTLFDGGKVERPQEDRAAWEASADEVKAKLSSATHVEVTYEDQKSGIKGVILVSRANMMFRGVGEDTCAVQSAARIVEDIIRQGGSKNTGINTVWLEGHANSQGKKTVLNSHNMTEALRATAMRIGEEILGFSASELVPHGLRTGGATAMMDVGATREQIEVRGRWAPGSTAVMSYLASTLRSEQPCFTEKRSEWDQRQRKD
jgi:hypothetical protein